MAEPSAPEPRAGGIVGRLTAKAGPLPVWAWALVILIGGYLAYRLLGNKTGSSSSTTTAAEDTPTPAIDSDTTPVGGDTGSPPGQSGMGSSADNLSADLYGQLTGLQGSVDALTSAVQLSPAFWPGDESTAGSGSGVPNGTTPAAPAKQQAAAKKAPAKPAAKAKAPASVRYYTYAPGKAPKNQKGNEAPGKGPAGTTLRFAKGKGYYYA